MQPPRLPKPLILTAWLLALPLLPLSAQLVYTEGFRGETADGWEFSQGNTSPGPRLTASAVPVAADPEFGAPALDNNGNGWLRLATTTTNQSNAVALDTSIAAQGASITVAFDFAFWKPGTDPADGITAFFWDASQPFNPGGFGGSLGYANRDGTIPGLAGGYVGAGLDVYGNYSNPTENRNGGTGMRPGEVAVRGPGSGQTGYEFLAGTGSNGIDSLTDTFGAGFSMDFINSPKRPDQDAVDYRRFEMTLDANNNLTVRMQDGYYGDMVDLFTVAVPGIRPDQLRFGFAGSTGGSVEVYEIRNLEVRVDGGTNAFYWDNEAGNTLWNAGLNWDQNVVPANHSHVYFTDQFPDTQTPQTVNVNIAPILNSMTFNGATPYTLTGSNTITFDTDGNGPSYLNVLNSPHGNANHSIAANIAAANALQIQNLVAQTLTLSGNVAGGSHPLTIVTGAGGQTTASGVISGSGTITTKGTGTTVFSANNTYTGTTTVEQGTLRIEHANALGATSGTTTVQDGATLALANNITTPAAQSLTLAGSGVGGTGALASASGVNTWQGGVNLAGDSTIGALGSSTLNINGVINTDNASGYTTTLYVDPSATLNINNNITDPWWAGANLIKTGEGIASLNAITSYTGNTYVQQGTLQANVAGALGTSWAGNVIVSDGATMALGGASYTMAAKPITIEGYGAPGKAALWNVENNHTWAQPVTLAGNASVGSASGTLTLTEGVTGGGHDLRITGPGTVSLGTGGSGVQSVGLLDIQSGTFRTGNNQQIGTNATSAARVHIASGATLDLTAMNGNEFLASLSGAGNMQMAANTTTNVTFGGNNQNTTFSGNISGGSALIKAGTGTTTFSGSNTFNNRLQINSGTVALGANNVFANTMGLTLSGGTFQTAGYADTMGLFTLTSNSNIDFLSTSGGYLTFADMTRTGGTLTIDNWSGSLVGNGNTRLQVLDNSLGSFGTGPGNLSNITFTGWGNAQLIHLGGSLYEIVPSTSGWSEWQSQGNPQQNRWDFNNNWINSSPNSAGARALIANLDANLNGRTIVMNGSNRTVGTLVIANTNGAAFNIAQNELIFNNNGNPANLTLTGNSSPTINSLVNLSDQLNISQNSTGTLTLNNANLYTNNNNLNVSGAGLTVIYSRA